MKGKEEEEELIKSKQIIVKFPKERERETVDQKGVRSEDNKRAQTCVHAWMLTKYYTMWFSLYIR